MEQERGTIPKDYDYVAFEFGSITLVKNDVKYPISEEEWKKLHPEHRNTDCQECAFVLDVSSILPLYVPREVRDKANHEPKFVGKFTMSGWTGHSSFYLFKCVECGSVEVDYPHGYHGPYWYLRCGECDYTIDLNSSKYRSIYEDNNGFVLKFVEEIGGWVKRNLLRLVTRN